MSKKLVYYFGGKKAEGGAEMKPLLGGKGANLAEMVNLKLRVPPGFTITTEVCNYYYLHKQAYPKELRKNVTDALKKIERELGSKFGDHRNPLLVSVRSGARASMPGMMDTILNLGLNDLTVQGLIQKTGNERFAYDSYRRFVQMYGDVVLGLKNSDESRRLDSSSGRDPFELIIEKKKEKKNISSDTELTASDLKELVSAFKLEIKNRTSYDFPEEPIEQLWGAIGAVFGSWMNERAITYRKLNNIPEFWGTAVNVQAMVFGNMGENSGTGVAFTRDPATGENIFYGEYLMNAQGEDVVAGIRTPLPIGMLKENNPKIYIQLEKVRKTLEKHYRDMMDIEFTIQEGKLYILQCRVGKRTGMAAARIATDMVKEKLITDKEALMRVEPDQLNQLLRPVFDTREKNTAIKQGLLLAKGLNAGPGAASGRIFFDAESVVNASSTDGETILVRIETSPEDIKGMNAAAGILTARGGMTSHAALVARQMGKVCVAGCSAIDIDYDTKVMKVKTPTGEKFFKQGTWISIDGTTGEVIEGKLETKDSEIIQVLIDKSLKPEDSAVFKVFDNLMMWADKYRRLKIRTNADQPDQCRNAIAFGAEGIGLCRTEHMFFGGDRIDAVREMILSENKEERVRALDKIFPFQREDFTGIFNEMGTRPVTVRTLDPPLHEFLPNTEAEQRELAEKMKKLFSDVKAKVDSLHEFNPMMGHRGCRLGIVYPEITYMQAKAILEAAALCKKNGLDVHPEIMIPLVGNYKELENQEVIVKQAAEKVFQNTGVKVDFLLGTMIEIPRAAITADEIAKEADFFSFGTNDLTQMTMGLSRDDSEKFLAYYLQNDIIPNDPFITLDPGVAELIKIAVEKGRQVKPRLKIGICGEHGGDPATVRFCNDVGLDYVSCSPFRIPIAKLAAAQAAVRSANGKKRKKNGKRKEKSKSKK